jgi:hypothetical protein
MLIGADAEVFVAIVVNLANIASISNESFIPSAIVADDVDPPPPPPPPKAASTSWQIASLNIANSVSGIVLLSLIILSYFDIWLAITVDLGIAVGYFADRLAIGSGYN